MYRWTDKSIQVKPSQAISFLHVRADADEVRSKKDLRTVISRANTPVKASIYAVDILAFTGSAYSGEYGNHAQILT